MGWGSWTQSKCWGNRVTTCCDQVLDLFDGCNAIHVEFVKVFFGVFFFCSSVSISMFLQGGFGLWECMACWC